MSSDAALHEHTFVSDSPLQSSAENASPTLESFPQTDDSNEEFPLNGKFSDFLFVSDSPLQRSAENASPTLESFPQTEESNENFLCNRKFSDFLFVSDSPLQNSTENASPTFESFPQTDESNENFLCNGKFSDFFSGEFVSGTRNFAVGSSAFDGLLNLNSSPSVLSPKGQKIHIFDRENACNDHLKEHIYGNCGAGSVAGSPTLANAIMDLHKFLPSNNEDESWPFIDVYSSDEFRMYDFKVRKCMRGRSHDWTECPFVHPGEKARRRDPRRFHYSGTACPDFRKGCCKMGDVCEYAHGVFECWLHPSRYRTQPCKDGRNCRRRVCFFAHTSEQLRVLPLSSQSGDTSSSRAALHSSSPKTSLGGCYDGSPLRQALTGSLDRGIFGTFDSPLSKICYGGPCCSAQICSPTSTLVGHSQSPPSFSPPPSPPGSPPYWNAVSLPYIGSLPNGVSSQQQPPVIIGNGNSGAVRSSVSAPAGAGHRRHLERLNPMLSVSIPAIEAGDSGHIISPRSISCDKGGHVMSNLLASIQQFELGTRTCQSTSISPRMSSLCPIPMSPSSVLRKDRLVDQKDWWGVNECEIGPQLERVESGRNLRAKIYGRLSKENPLESDSPDLDWVNELVK